MTTKKNILFWIARHTRIWTRAARLTCLLCLFALVPILLQGPFSAMAAGFAEDHTILYYLIEMQRRAKRTCNGAPMPEAPSLMPSENLRSLAARSASSGQPMAQIAAENGLSGIPYLAATAHGSTPQQAFDALVSGQCSALMGQEFHYIGASAHNGQWTLIMAAAEPQQASVSPPVEGAIVHPAAPGLSSAPPAGGTPQDLSIQIRSHAQPTVSPTEAQSPIAADEGPGPANTTMLGGHSINPESEFASADPIIVREFATDGRGRVLNSGASSAPKSARPGVMPLEDTRPPEATSDDGAALLVLRPDAQPDAQSAAPAGIIPQPGAQTGTRNAAPVGTMPVRTTASLAQAGSQEARMLGLINEVRVQGRVCGGEVMPPAAPLRGSGVLDASAREHVRDMAARRYFSSTTPDGRTLGKRVTDGGYTWGFVAENLAAGRSVADETLHKWLGNENQCRNLMERESEDIGVGFDPAGPYWSVILAAPLKEQELPTR